MRESLVRCCESVDAQTFAEEWEHIIAVDSDTLGEVLLKRIEHSQRIVFTCGKKFGNYGNHARWMAWGYATGDFLIGLDDDNFLAHPNALQDIHDALESPRPYPAWALFPIMRHGSKFLLEPPGMCMTDTANMVIRREYGRWPDIEAREADGVLAERLKAEYPYVSFPQLNPIIVMEKSSDGI